MVAQVLRVGTENYNIMAIEGASLLMPLSWLILLVGWSCLPMVSDGRMGVTVQPAEGEEVELTERSKMRYLDQGDIHGSLTRCLEEMLPVKWHDS